MSIETGRFSVGDLARQTVQLLIHTGNPVEVYFMIVSGIQYNQAKTSQDREAIYHAYLALHPELKLMKHNSTRGVSQQ